MRKDDRILILQEAKFIWSQEEVDRATALFSDGLRPTQVADLMDEKIIDTSILYLHLLDKGRINLGG